MQNQNIENNKPGNSDEAIAKNNPKYFKQIFNSFYSPLCNYAFKIVNNKDEAEDIVQDLFLQLYEKQALLNVNDTERYLIKSIKFKCIDYLRRKKNIIEINDSTISAEGANNSTGLLEEEIEPLMHYFAAKLPPKTREVFLLSRVSNLTYKEISKKLNISVKTVEVQMGRALRHLKELLKLHNFLSLIFFLLFFHSE